MGELFTFFGLISHDKSFIYLTHMLLSAGIALVLVRVAMSNLQVVPKGTQNVMEAYISGVLKNGGSAITRSLPGGLREIASICSA